MTDNNSNSNQQNSSQTTTNQQNISSQQPSNQNNNYSGHVKINDTGRPKPNTVDVGGIQIKSIKQ
jgi:hypothetical protein